MELGLISILQPMRERANRVGRINDMSVLAFIFLFGKVKVNGS